MKKYLIVILFILFSNSVFGADYLNQSVRGKDEIRSDEGFSMWIATKSTESTTTMPIIFNLNFIDSNANDFNYGNDFTAINSPTYSRVNSVYYADLELDSGQYFSRANGTWDNNLVNGFSVIALIKLESGVGVNRYFVSKYLYDGTTPANNELEFAFLKDSNEYLNLLIYDNSVCQSGTLTYIGRRTSVAMALDTWYLVIGIYYPDAGTSADVNLYQIKLSDLTTSEDVADSEANAGSFVAIEDSDTAMVVGGYTSTGAFDGIIGFAEVTEAILANSETTNSLAQIYKGRLGL